MAALATLIAGASWGGRPSTTHEWRQALIDRHALRIADVTAGARGPTGPFFLAGDLGPPAADPRAAVRAVLTEHAGLLGVGDPTADLHETWARTDRHGRLHVAFERRVAGLPLLGMEVLVHLDGAGAAQAVNGVLVPVDAAGTDAIRAAAAVPLLTEPDVRAIVARDVAPHGALRRTHARLVARPTAPWVIWRADTSAGSRRFVHEVDAVTGGILGRRDATHHSESPPRGHEPAFLRTARLVNWSPGLDADMDGFFETFSVEVEVDADWPDPLDAGYVAALIRCPTTGDLFPTTFWRAQGQAVDPQRFRLTESDFNLGATGNVNLDFTVELWDAAFFDFHDSEPTVTGEPLRADRIPSGPAIGTGVGVLGTALSHVDTTYDGAARTFYLSDVTRRIAPDPHGHEGRMALDAFIATSRDAVPQPVLLSDVDNAWSAASQASAVDAHVGAAITYDYLRAVLDLNGPDGAGSSMRSVVDVACPSDNAAWDGEAVLFCAPVTVASLAGALDIVAHEWGHAVTELAARPRRDDLEYAGEPGALNEAFSDWLGVAVERARGETNWTLGEGIEIVRDLANPPAYGQPDTYVDDPLWQDLTGCVPAEENDLCGVHQNSGVPNKMFHLLAAGGVHDGVSVTGLGANLAMTIALDANLLYWPATATFAQARAGMLEAAEPSGQEAVNQVANAWAAVGVGLPAGPSGWGDVAPRGATDGVVNVADVVLALRFAVALDAPTPDERRRADVTPFDTIAPGPPPLVRPVPDGRIDVADVVLLLRVAVGLSAFGT
jgi:Zn-dependent metalloprotease